MQVVTQADIHAEQDELLPPPKSLLDEALDEPIPLQNVPEGRRLRSVTATEGWIDARFTGRSVAFRPDVSSRVRSVDVRQGAPGDLVGVVRR